MLGERSTQNPGLGTESLAPGSSAQLPGDPGITSLRSLSYETRKQWPPLPCNFPPPPGERQRKPPPRAAGSNKEESCFLPETFQAPVITEMDGFKSCKCAKCPGEMARLGARFFLYHKCTIHSFKKHWNAHQMLGNEKTGKASVEGETKPFALQKE